mmetsp:Transcript_126975/g.225100  ORF Transcript_126975/g.225100 Transcript_126975/m.225100 type:complete len:100 (+) Transcript_126975:1015-1314(+)
MEVGISRADPGVADTAGGRTVGAPLVTEAATPKAADDGTSIGDATNGGTASMDGGSVGGELGAGASAGSAEGACCAAEPPFTEQAGEAADACERQPHEV